MSRAFSLYLDLVRFLAALLVVFYHANLIYRPGLVLTSLGHEAVVIFFVLSGYVIAYVAETREHDFRGFMLARAARIFSVAIPAIILTAGFDAAGFHIDPSVYPENYRAWDLPIVRVISSALFLNEIWTLGIQLFTNVPYWSLNYEVWYYILFGIIFFYRGRGGRIVFVLVCILLGPKIMLLLPIWWLGVWIYQSRRLQHIPDSMAWLCLFISIAGGYWYIHADLGAWGWDYLKRLMGEELHLQLSFSRQFITDYYLALILALHFVGVRALLANVNGLPALLERPIRYLAGSTFSIYLFHQPLLWFFSSVFSWVEAGRARYMVVVPMTLVTVFILSLFTERKKNLWKGWLVWLLSCLELAGSRFRQLRVR